MRSFLKAVPLAGAVLCLASCFAVKEQAGPKGQQGWTRTEQMRWYHADQGSRLLPLSWLRALEAADGSGRFFTTARMASLGFLPPDPDDETGLPIGFSFNESSDEEFVRSKLRWYSGQGKSERWAGLTCAACHTGEVRVGERRIRIDGAPSILDFQSFVEQVDAALFATLEDPARFERFARAVLNPGSPAPNRDEPGNREALRRSLSQLVAWQRRLEAMNRPGVRYGFARLDAFGHIFNKVAVANGADQTGFEAPANAPVSYPFLWNVPQHDKVQWNGIAPNRQVRLPGGVFDVGGLGRNSGEVIGVFADVHVMPHYPGLKGYPSSIRAKNLDAIEDQLGRLLPPAWPFEPPTPALVARGRSLFEQKCQSCHIPLDRMDLKTPIKAVMTPIWARGGVGTDPWMACNAFTYRARTGNLAGVPTGYLKSREGGTFGEVADTREMLAVTVAGSLAGKKREIAGSLARSFFGLPRPIAPLPPGFVLPETAQKTPADRLAICQQNASNAFMAYKARPLTGIWATAPYLHNGSVRSLTELLLPPARRARTFPVGQVQFDPVNVGLGAPVADGRYSLFRVGDETGGDIVGNSNLGHDYGNAELLEEPGAIEALVAYMKTL